MLYLSTVLPTVSYIIAIIILWQQQSCIRIRFVLSIILFISLMFLFCLPASSLLGRAGKRPLSFWFLSATCKASSHLKDNERRLQAGACFNLSSAKLLHFPHSRNPQHSAFLYHKHGIWDIKWWHKNKFTPIRHYFLSNWRLIVLIFLRKTRKFLITVR